PPLERGGAHRRPRRLRARAVAGRVPGDARRDRRAHGRIVQAARRPRAHHVVVQGKVRRHRGRSGVGRFRRRFPMSARPISRSTLKTYSLLGVDRRVPTDYEVTTTRLLYYTANGFEIATPLRAWYARFQTGSPLV